MIPATSATPLLAMAAAAKWDGKARVAISAAVAPRTPTYEPDMKYACLKRDEPRKGRVRVGHIPSSNVPRLASAAA